MHQVWQAGCVWLTVGNFTFRPELLSELVGGGGRVGLGTGPVAVAEGYSVQTFLSPLSLFEHGIKQETPCNLPGSSWERNSLIIC